MTGIEIFKQIAGFSSDRADIARRMIGKKSEKLLLELKQEFLSGVTKNGYTKDLANTLFEWIKGFAGYGFNLSHSILYSYIGYLAAWLKTHYPLEFMCACLQTDYDDRDKVLQYIAYCKDKGIEVFPPDVNEPVLEFGIVETSLRFGIAGVKNVGRGVAKSIIRCRKEGKFSSIQDFINRVVAYDADKIIDILMKENNILYKEALEYFDYNIVGAWMGDDSPVFIWTLTTKKTILKPTLTKFDIMDV